MCFEGAIEGSRLLEQYLVRIELEFQVILSSNDLMHQFVFDGIALRLKSIRFLVGMIKQAKTCKVFTCPKTLAQKSRSMRGEDLVCMVLSLEAVCTTIGCPMVASAAVLQ